MASTTEQPARRYLRAPRAIHFPTEAEVPETKRHLDIRTGLYLILKQTFQEQALIGSEQFVYWDATDPSECLAPDAFVRLGAPDEQFDSWKVWERGAPHLAVEVVSGSDASDAAWAPKLRKYHRLGVQEVVRFDPEAVALRVWDRVEEDLVERSLVDGQPVDCVPLGLYWVVVPGELSLRLARDPAGTSLLPTPAEAERIKADAERGRADVAQRARDEALERVRLLEAELAKERSG